MLKPVVNEKIVRHNFFSFRVCEIKPFGVQKMHKNSDAYLFLKKYEPAQLLYSMASVKRRQTKRWIARHAASFAQSKTEMTGDDLLQMGYKPGPWIGEVLEAIKLERMDGHIKTRDDEMRYLDETLTRR